MQQCRSVVLSLPGRSQALKIVDDLIDTLAVDADRENLRNIFNDAMRSAGYIVVVELEM